jgi:mono/diheme cytochrome c family protein
VSHHRGSGAGRQEGWACRFAAQQQTREEAVRRSHLAARLGRIAAVLLLTAVAVVRAQEPLTPTDPADSPTEGLAEGQSLFNQYCSHCHGPNAVQGERPRDLRRLKLRYGDHWRAKLLSTVEQGRPDCGMPSWKGTLSDETIAKISVFLEHVQQ